MEPSILKSVKKVLGLSPEYSAFDEDVMMHINTSFATLNDLGVGPADTFFITGESETWDMFLAGNNTVQDVKTYVVMRVRLIYDPPATSFVIAAMEKQISELEWRLTVRMEVKAQ